MENQMKGTRHPMNVEHGLPHTTIQLQFLAHETANSFYAARTQWNTATPYQYISVCVFYRRALPTREAAYCVAIYQHFAGSARYVAVERSFEAIETRMRSYGYQGAVWQELTRDTFSHYIAAADLRRLWREGYGIKTEQGTFNAATALPYRADCIDLDAIPF